MSQQPASTDDGLFSFEQDVYRTTPRHVSWFSRTFPTFSFYRQFFWNVYRSSVKAKRGAYGDREWSRSSHEVLVSLESVGVQFELSGIEHIRQLETPCVFVANHMSMFETIVLPAIIQPVRPVTFVVKQSLLQYPVFRHIVCSRDPIAVSRENPREDLKTVMSEGVKRLQNGISIVVFPQTTRALTFDAAQFNSIGVKLALRANVPVIPTALKTDAWGNGKWFKDLGPIDPNKRVHLAFGAPISIEGRGTEQQREIINYITDKLDRWNDQPAE